jgi:peptidyl-dipeptidase A
VKTHRALTALSLSIAIALSAGCSRSPEPAKPTAADADAFVARVNDQLRKDYPEITSAQWLASTYINTDSQRISAKALERALAQLGVYLDEAKQFDGLELKPETARAIALLKLSTAMPAPKDPAKLAELTQLATKMEGMYGAGKYCTDASKPETCRDLGELSSTLANSRDYDAQLDAWRGWRTISVPMRADYQQFAALLNEGAAELGFANAGEMWRAGYDMSPAEFQVETDRLWGQVEPLYKQLHCYVRSELVQQYGADKGQVDGMIPAHLTGNMWAQQWGNIWDLVEPYKGAGSLDVGTTLSAQRNAEFKRLLGEFKGLPTALQQAELSHQADLAVATKMTQRAEDFYRSLGMPALPESFYQRSQLTKPRDRDVVCHASAWDMDYQGDVRIKMCIEPTADEFTTIYHELGHIFYYLAYNHLPPLFQSGAHDGFHEAIGDTMVLAMTPGYLSTIGLVDKPRVSDEALINGQLRMALEKVAFLPFGLMIDRWRWGVFDGSIAPENYNAAWWQLRAKYQGVAAVGKRGEEFFDPGAKYHVPGNTPYTRYFLAHILQFQFYKALCDASGHTGPLHECSFYGNKAAGEKFWAMLQKGQSQPWPQTLKELTGSEQMDASAILDYFAPLKTWLEAKNDGQECGWPGEGV